MTEEYTGTYEGSQREDGDVKTRTQKPKKKKWNKEAVIGLCGALIPLIGFVLFNIFPVALSVGAMFCDVDHGQIDTMVWNNFANFTKAFTDKRFFHSIGITLWLASAQFVSLTIALFISYLLSKKRFGHNIFQILFFIPYICSSVAVSIMWQIIFSYNGVLSTIFNSDVNWFMNVNNPGTLTWIIFVTVIWQAPGYGIVMFKAAFTAVNPALYEAAAIDGATEWNKFWHITIPGIAPTIFFLIMAGIGAGLTMFDQAMIMAPTTGGIAGYEDMGLTLSYYIYIRTNEFQDMTSASIMSWCLFVVSFGLQLIVYKVRRRFETEV